MTDLFTVDNVVALLTLTALEIVLGIDNIVFIAILAGKLREQQRATARRVGLALAMIMRVALLLGISWVMSLTTALFTIPQFWTGKPAEPHPVSGRDLILLAGGLFLIFKATYEIHDKLEGHAKDDASKSSRSFFSVVVQIVLIDIVFSLDSVITAVGMVDPKQEKWINLTIMITAVIVAVLVMLAFAGVISRFVEHHPTLKMLALSFLILIGVLLLAEGFHFHIPKGYVYFAMAFSLIVEMLNMRMRKTSSPVTLHQSYVPVPDDMAKS